MLAVIAFRIKHLAWTWLRSCMNIVSRGYVNASDLHCEFIALDHRLHLHVQNHMCIDLLTLDLVPFLQRFGGRPLPRPSLSSFISNRDSLRSVLRAEQGMNFQKVPHEMVPKFIPVRKIFQYKVLTMSTRLYDTYQFCLNEALPLLYGSENVLYAKEVRLPGCGRYWNKCIPALTITTDRQTSTTGRGVTSLRGPSNHIRSIDVALGILSGTKHLLNSASHYVQTLHCSHQPHIIMGSVIKYQLAISQGGVLLPRRAYVRKPSNKLGRTLKNTWCQLVFSIFKCGCRIAPNMSQGLGFEGLNQSKSIREFVVCTALALQSERIPGFDLMCISAEAQEGQ
ncbi:hypothetical protein VNO77_03820 [Canavalia gladiata]|uniref:Uncharacterized protein n=1 Tax=Canavalia gladiata TaxID=3824 RepID=A0AAN9MVJ2_CANGL